MEHNFQGKEGQTLPDLPDEFRLKVFSRYSELYEMLTGSQFVPVLEKDFNGTLEDVFSDF